MNLVITAFFASAFAFAEPMTLKKWSALDDEQKLTAIYNGGAEFEEVEHSVGGSVDEFIASTDDPFLKAQLKALSEDALAEVSRDEIEGDIDAMETIVSIGDPVVSWVTVISIESQPVALRIGLWQDGGQTDDESSPKQSHYESQAEAEADGIDTGADVCWSSNATYLIEGGSWRNLTYDDWEGRGFSWCGF